MTEVKGSARYSPPPKIPSPCLHPSAIIAPCANAFKMHPELHNMQRYTRWAWTTQYAALHKMQPKLHNSADRNISKFFYLRICLVVCFCPWPPAWPWSWGHTYRQISVNWRVWSGWCCFFIDSSRSAPIFPCWLLRNQVSGPREYHHSRLYYFTVVSVCLEVLLLPLGAVWILLYKDNSDKKFNPIS